MSSECPTCFLSSSLLPTRPPTHPLTRERGVNLMKNSHDPYELEIPPAPPTTHTAEGGVLDPAHIIPVHPTQIPNHTRQEKEGVPHPIAFTHEPWRGGGGQQNAHGIKDFHSSLRTRNSNFGRLEALHFRSLAFLLLKACSIDGWKNGLGLGLGALGALGFCCAHI